MIKLLDEIKLALQADNISVSERIKLIEMARERGLHIRALENLIEHQKEILKKETKLIPETKNTSQNFLHEDEKIDEIPPIEAYQTNTIETVTGNNIDRPANKSTESLSNNSIEEVEIGNMERENTGNIEFNKTVIEPPGALNTNFDDIVIDISQKEDTTGKPKIKTNTESPQNAKTIEKQDKKTKNLVEKIENPKAKSLLMVGIIALVVALIFPIVGLFIGISASSSANKEIKKAQKSKKYSIKSMSTLNQARLFSVLALLLGGLRSVPLLLSMLKLL